MKRILNVKQAAKILGVSTNTMYKYLNQGTVSAARGQGQGSFRIPAKSLETFLGSKLPEEELTVPASKRSADPEYFEDPEYSRRTRGTTNTLLPLNQKGRREPITIQVTPPSLTVKVARTLLIIVLLLMLGDVFLSPNFSLNNQFVRLAMVVIFILLAYQFGGFVKK